MKKLTVSDLSNADRKALVKMWVAIDPFTRADIKRNDFPKKEDETHEDYICRYYTEYCNASRAKE